MKTPFEAGIAQIVAHPRRPGALLRLQGWIEPPAIVEVDAKSGDLRKTGIQPPTKADFSAMDEVRRTRNLYREQLPFLVDQQKRLQGNLTQLQSLDKSLRGHPDTKVNLDTATVEDIVRRLRTLAADTTNATEQREWRARLITLYRQLGDNVQFRVVDAQARDNLENALTVFQAERALAVAEINLREREAVILRGLDGLVAFHQGGIDADDVRNLIMIAQAFGIIAIAAK